MLIDSIKTGDRVEISYRYMPVGRKPYISKVEAILKKNQLIIHAPISAGAIVKLPKDEEYILRFITEKCVYRFSATVYNFKKVDGFPVAYFKLLDEGVRIQNRNFFRMVCSIPFTFSIVEATEDGTEQAKYEGHIRDLGGGGMKMMSKLCMEPRTVITGVLELESESLLVFGEIRHRLHNVGAVVPYQYGIKFASMSKLDQEKLVQYLTNEQLKALQRFK